MKLYLGDSYNRATKTTWKKGSMYWLISTEHLHKVAPTMNSQSRDSTKLLEEAGRIQHLVQIGFDTRISRTEQKSTRLGCTLSTKEASTKAIFPKSGQIASWDLLAEWIPHPYNAKHHWEAHGTHCCQETHQRPQGEGGTPCKLGGGGGDSDQENAHWKMQLHLHMTCTKDFRGKNSGCSNQSRGCLQQSPVQAANGPAHSVWSQPNTDPVGCRSAPGKNSGYAAWKLELCSSSAHNGPTTRITTLVGPLQCLR